MYIDYYQGNNINGLERVIFICAYPSKRGNYELNLFDDSFWWNFFDNPLVKINESSINLKSDIYKRNNHIIIETDLPGYRKEDINVNYENGYLNIVARKEEKESDQVYYRKERRSISECSRSFYVGEIDEKEVTAAFNDGVLILTYPIKEDKKRLENKRNIEIA